MRNLIGLGWFMFAISGVLYLVSGLRTGDLLVIWGSVVWLLGVGVFLAGVAAERRDE